MTELARGAVGDRPWGRTLAALGARALTGQVSIICDGKLYQIAFEHGAIVGAVSPLAADSASRVALTLHLVSSTQVAEVSRRASANPNRDEVDIITEYMRIAADQSMRLRRRTIATRAARTFAIDHGDFVIEDQIDLAIVPGSEIDVRGIIYMGASQHLTETRLASELAKLGSWFQIKQEAIPELAQFGFGDAERPILNALVAGTSLGALEKAGLDPRSVRSVVYALASSGACETEAPQQRAAPAPVQVPSRIQQPSRIVPARAQTPPPVATPMPDTFSAARTAARAGSSESIEMPTLRRDLPQVQARVQAPPPQQHPVDLEMLELEPATTMLKKPLAAPAGRTGPAPATVAATAKTQELIAARMKLVEANADHFQLLGVTEKSTDDQIRKAYFALARQLHPDRLAQLGMTGDAKTGQRLFAQINAAFGVVSDAERKAEYISILRRGGEAAIRAEQAKADAMVTRTLDAEDAFHRGEMALRRDSLPQAIVEFKKAVELNPDEAEYQVLLGWAQFCAAPDKVSEGPVLRAKYAKMITKNPQAVVPRFYLGRMERMLGRDPEALKVFESVLRVDPEHAESIAEIRVLQARLQTNKIRR